MTVEIPGKLQCNLKKIEPCCSLRQRIWYHLMLKEVDDADSKHWPPRYNWNIVESGVEHHKPNHIIDGSQRQTYSIIR
jgi:hypothetical protein